jgi:Na+/proline symporter
MGLLKIIKLVALLLSVVGVILYLMIFLKGDQAIKDALFNGEEVAILDWALYVAYIIFALVLAFVLFSGLKGFLSGDVKKTILPVVVLLVIIAISYVLADGTEMPMKEGILSETGSKWVGTGLYSFYILAILAIAVMIISGFKKAK